MKFLEKLKDKQDLDENPESTLTDVKLLIFSELSELQKVTMMSSKPSLRILDYSILKKNKIETVIVYHLFGTAIDSQDCHIFINLNLELQFSQLALDIT